MVDQLGWASIFWVSFSFALFAIVMVLTFVAKAKQAPAGASGVDMVRGVLFAPGIAGLLLALTQSRQWGWNDPKIITMLAGSVLVLVYWGRHQLRQANPLIDLRLLAERRVALAYICISLIGAGLMQVILVMSMFIQQPTATSIGLGLGATTAGVMLMPIRVIGLVASPWGGWMSGRHGARLTLLIGTFLGLAGWAVIALGRHEAWAVLVGMVLEGAGFTVAYVAVPNILLQAVPQERSGEALGLSSVFRSAFSAVGSQIVMWLLATSSVTLPHIADVRFPSETAYLLTFSYIMVTCVLCAIAAYLLPRHDSWQHMPAKATA
jgi:predicted MFS family arabinose efflux permease